MTVRPKSSYHPYLLVAFYLQCLPDDLLTHIPRSTKHGWLHKEQTSLFGYEWYRQNQSSFDTLQQLVSHKRLLKINRAFLRIIALQKFIQHHAERVKDNILNINQVVLDNISKTTSVLGLRTTLKFLQRSYQWYLKIRRRQKCHSSIFSLCRIKHPAQLLLGEIRVITAYCSDIRFLHWPLSSVYHQIRRDGAAGFALGTFYKYVSLLQIKRSNAAKRRKNHHIGIRAHSPLQILHADSTIFKTADNQKNYVHLIQDNFSRAILGYRVATECRAHNTFENLQAIIEQYLVPANITSCQLLTDDGSENAGPVKELIAACPSITHLIAQRDIAFSNSMIEAANKQLKYRFLYHQHIPDHEALLKYVRQAVEDYNNRPHDVLQGLTPFEILNGMRFDKMASQQQIHLAKSHRIAENKKTKCCYYSF